MRVVKVEVTLTVTREGDAWRADVTFKNVGTESAPLNPYMLPGQADVFRVTNGDAKAGYRGAYVKRSPPERDEFVMLAPGASTTYSTLLDYKLDPGQHRARYEAFHGGVKHFDGLWKLESNEVSF
jgi:hypothetical protein